jgi:hypothetical protein
MQQVRAAASVLNHAAKAIEIEDTLGVPQDRVR